MKKNNLIILAALLLTACDYNDKYFDGLDESTLPSDVKKLEYALTDNDYSVIANNSTNIDIAKKDGEDKTLGYLKTDKYFSEKLSSMKYLPAFLADKYYGGDEGSSVRVTFSYKDAKSPLHESYASVKYLKLTGKDYEHIYGTSAYAPYLNENNELQALTEILKSNYSTMQDGSVVYLDYKMGSSSQSLKDMRLWETFENIALSDLKELEGWVVSAKGAQWKGTAYNWNQYLQCSANATGEQCESWLITPDIDVNNVNLKFRFDVNVGYYNAACLSVWISEDFDGTNIANATWTNITSNFNIPQNSKWGNLTPAGAYSLDAYNGKKVRIAFKYEGDDTPDDKNLKKTTSYQIDNVMVGSDFPTSTQTSQKFAARVLKGTSWNNTDTKVYSLSYDDYNGMGQSKTCYFTSEVSAGNYMPTYVANKFSEEKIPYPMDKDARIVLYRYSSDNGKTIKIYSDEYLYSTQNMNWSLNNNVIVKTEQYVLNGGKWNFDPSTTITLKADKSDAGSTTFYTAIVDWVKANHKDYVTSYGNNEYYFGSSYYQNNFDFRFSAWKDYYEGKGEEEVTKLMWERLTEAFLPALESLYADADVVSGVDVIYTINFAVYEGTNPAPMYTIKYKVVNKGKFEYVEDSLKKQE